MIAFCQRICLPRMRQLLRVTLAAAISSCAGIASAAGYATTFESGLDAIFSQTSFGSNSIDIRFNPAETVAAANLLSLDSNQEFFSLSALRGGLSERIVSVFFVDAIPFCGVAGPNFIGCGDTPGNLIALTSSAANNLSIGANLLAHELGHNLGLPHADGSNDNLMNPTINSFSLTAGSFLDPEQVALIFHAVGGPGTALSNKIIQNDGNGYFISITPFLVVSAVPEPQTWLMMGIGLLGLVVQVRRRARPVAWHAA